MIYIVTNVSVPFTFFPSLVCHTSIFSVSQVLVCSMNDPIFSIFGYQKVICTFFECNHSQEILERIYCEIICQVKENTHC